MKENQYFFLQKIPKTTQIIQSQNFRNAKSERYMMPANA